MIVPKSLYPLVVGLGYPDNGYIDPNGSNVIPINVDTDNESIKNELKNALATANAGDIIYIEGLNSNDDRVEINLSGEQLGIPGVSL